MEGNATWTAAAAVVVLTVKRVEDVAIGSVFGGFSLVILLFYVPCLVIMATDEDLRSHACYRMMAQLGLSDVINTLTQLVAGVFMLFDVWSTAPLLLNKFLGATNALAWFCYTVLMHMIAFNRALQMWYPERVEEFFDKRRTTVWIAVAWAYSLGQFAIFMSPMGGFLWFNSIWTWFYDLEPAWGVAHFTVCTYLNYFNFIGSSVWYVLVLVKLRMQMGLQGGGGALASEAAKRERSVLLQACLICLYVLSWDMYWRFGTRFYTSWRYGYALGSLLYISNAAINPLVYLTLNKTIKRRFLSMFCACCVVKEQQAVRTAGRSRSNMVSSNSRKHVRVAPNQAEDCL